MEVSRGGIKEYQGVCRVYFVSETAQVELRSGRVFAPARRHGREPRLRRQQWHRRRPQLLVWQWLRQRRGWRGAPRR